MLQKNWWTKYINTLWTIHLNKVKHTITIRVRPKKIEPHSKRQVEVLQELFLHISVEEIAVPTPGGNHAFLLLPAPPALDFSFSSLSFPWCLTGIPATLDAVDLSGRFFPCWASSFELVYAEGLFAEDFVLVVSLF